jgi:hypothetical protein
MLWRSCFLTAVLASAACGDDPVRKLPDAPIVPDAPADAPLDARAIDAPLDAPVMLTTFVSGLGTLCGIAYDHVDTQVWVYPCDSATVTRFSPAGTVLGTLARPGEVANDVDVDVAPVALTLGVTALAAGDLIVVNGETGVAELYAPETTATAALVTTFGASHVVGGAYHTTRASVFAVQDRVAAAGQANVIAELDPITGAERARFSTLPAFDVNYGDLDVCQATGNLFVVSSIESTIAEFTATGTLVAEYPLPAAVTLASGIGIEDGTGAAWISGTGGGVWRVTGLPCGS